MRGDEESQSHCRKIKPIFSQPEELAAAVGPGDGVGQVAKGTCGASDIGGC